LTTDYVIIGGSIGALGAVEGIRRYDPRREIVVVSEEKQTLYSRPSIGKYLEGDLNEISVGFGSTDLWSTNNVKVLQGSKALSLDAKRKSIQLDDGGCLSFHKLLLATGARPILPRIGGFEKSGVHTFSSVGDVQAIRAELPRIRHAVVVGGGLIGVAAAEALANLNVEVTIVELRNWLLSLSLSREAAAIIEGAMKQCGVNIITGLSVKEIEGRKECPSEVGGVVLSDESRLSCDLVVAAIGVTPRTELALQAGIKVNRGILVDRFMQTNVPGIYACGDVAEGYSFLEGKNQVLPLWPLARLGGRVAGSNMAGDRVEYPGGVSMSAMRYFGVPIISVGTVGQAVPENGEILASSSRNARREVVLVKDQVVGFTLLGDVEAAGPFFDLLRTGTKVSGFKTTLLDPSFGFAHLPEPVRNAALMEAWS